MYSIYIYMYIYIYIYIYTYIYIYIYVCIYMYVCMYVCMHVCMYMHAGCTPSQADEDEHHKEGQEDKEGADEDAEEFVGPEWNKVLHSVAREHILSKENTFYRTRTQYSECRMGVKKGAWNRCCIFVCM